MTRLLSVTVAAICLAASSAFGAAGSLSPKHCGVVSSSAMICVAQTEEHNNEYLVLRLPTFIVVAPVMQSESRGEEMTRTAYYVAHRGLQMANEVKIVLTTSPSEDGTKLMGNLTIGGRAMSSAPFEMKEVKVSEDTEEAEEAEETEETEEAEEPAEETEETEDSEEQPESY